MTNKGMSAKLSKATLLGALSKKQGRTAGELLQGLKLSKPTADDWKNWIAIILRLLRALLESGLITSAPRRLLGKSGRPPLEFFRK